MKYRKVILETGTEILLGKNEDSNDELMKEFNGKSNVILHTRASGSPFCVILKPKPAKQEIYMSATFCSRYSQDWRDNKGDVIVDVFTGENISKSKLAKKGSWSVKIKKQVKIKKEDILKLGI